APAGHRHPTSKLHGQVQEALDALDVGGEGGRHDPSGRFSEDPLERADEVTFGAAVAGALSVGGVAEQQQDTLLAELAEALEVRGRTHRWVVVELEVARVDDLPDGGFDRQGGGVRDAVVDADELDA